MLHGVFAAETPMADPIDHGPQARGPHDPPHNARLAEDTPRKGAFPLIWLLVLASLLAFGWSIYNHYAGESSPAPTPPAAGAPAGAAPPAPSPP
jgi:hypothetical protein